MNGNKSKTHFKCLMAMSLLLSFISNGSCAFNCTGLGAYPKPQTNCRSYIVCYEQNNSGFVAEERNCENGQVFSEYESKCVSSQSYSCLEEPCSYRIGRFLKPDTDCQDYYLCSNVNNAIIYNTYSCPDGSKFSSLTSRCESGYQCESIQPRQSAPTTARPGATTARPGATTARPGSGGGVTTARPTTNQIVEIQTPSTTPGNLLAVLTASAATTAKPPTPTCSTNCIMTTKTGLYAHSTDPCSYVSCTRTADILYCANMKCDPGQAFAQQSGRCIASNLCPQKPK